MFVIILRYISRETAIKTERLLIDASNKYIHDLEESYKALRTIKHDYVNILTSFKLYIDSNDIEGLAKYYYDELAEMNKDLLHQDKLIGSLHNVQISEVKSILIYKGSVAAQQEIDINVESREPIEEIGASTAIVCQIIGILLDNAIEAAQEAEERKLEIAVVKNPNSKAFIIKNTWNEQDLPLNKLSELGYSTKGENRGIGLHTVRNYTEKIKGLYLETEISGNYFCQTLTVKDD
jgi:two-component system sensor histidine kinase AgrC